MCSDDEQADLAAICRRETEAWAAFYNSLVHATYALIWHLTGGNRSTAEDLNQETWLAAIESIDDFDPQRGSLRGWLFGIARNKAVAHLRRQKVRDANVQRVSQASAIAGNAPQPDALAEADEHAAFVRAALAILPPDWRGVLRGKYVDGLTVNQLAEQMGRTPKAVESLLSRSRAELREMLNTSVN